MQRDERGGLSGGNGDHARQRAVIHARRGRADDGVVDEQFVRDAAGAREQEHARVIAALGGEIVRSAAVAGAGENADCRPDRDLVVHQRQRCFCARNEHVARVLDQREGDQLRAFGCGVSDGDEGDVEIRHAGGQYVLQRKIRWRWRHRVVAVEACRAGAVQAHGERAARVAAPREAHDAGVQSGLTEIRVDQSKTNLRQGHGVEVQ